MPCRIQYEAVFMSKPELQNRKITEIQLQWKSNKKKDMITLSPRTVWHAVSPRQSSANDRLKSQNTKTARNNLIKERQCLPQCLHSDFHFSSNLFSESLISGDMSEVHWINVSRNQLYAN